MVGSALYKKLKETSNIIITKSKSNLDLTNEKKVINLFKKHDFDQVYICAAKVGGIHANETYEGEWKAGKMEGVGKWMKPHEDGVTTLDHKN